MYKCQQTITVSWIYNKQNYNNNVFFLIVSMQNDPDAIWKFWNFIRWGDISATLGTCWLAFWHPQSTRLLLLHFVAMWVPKLLDTHIIHQETYKWTSRILLSTYRAFCLPTIFYLLQAFIFVKRQCLIIRYRFSRRHLHSERIHRSRFYLRVDFGYNRTLLFPRSHCPWCAAAGTWRSSYPTLQFKAWVSYHQHFLRWLLWNSK